MMNIGFDQHAGAVRLLLDRGFILVLQDPALSSCRRRVMKHFPQHLAIALKVSAPLFISSPARSQVLEATLYGVVHDSTGGILPGATVVVVQQGTNLTRETVSNERGEFALPALPAGTYALKIALAGFKTSSSQGLTLAASQPARQTYVLEVGNLSETVTVAENAPLVQTASLAQIQSIGGEVREIPVSRRNLQNVVLLAPGVSSSDSALGGGPAISRQRRWRWWQRAHRRRQQRTNQSREPRVGQLRRPEPDRDHERRGSRRGASRQGGSSCGVRRLDRRAGQHDHPIGDEQGPRLAAGEFSERHVLVARSVFAQH